MEPIPGRGRPGRGRKGEPLPPTAAEDPSAPTLARRPALRRLQLRSPCSPRCSWHSLQEAVERHLELDKGMFQCPLGIGSPCSEPLRHLRGRDDLYGACECWGGGGGEVQGRLGQVAAASSWGAAPRPLGAPAAATFKPRLKPVPRLPCRPSSCAPGARSPPIFTAL